MTSTGNTPAVATSPGSPPSVDLLEKFADELSAWSDACDNARSWGGPTMYPALLFTGGNRNDEARADRIAKAVRALLDRAREAGSVLEVDGLRVGPAMWRALTERAEKAEVAEQAAHQALGVARETVLALTAERDRMAEALKSFADQTETWANTRGDELWVPGWMRPAIARARQALQSDGRGE